MTDPREDALAKARASLETIRLKLSYAGQDAVSPAVAQSNLNAAWHESVRALAELAALSAPPSQNEDERYETFINTVIPGSSGVTPKVLTDALEASMNEVEELEKKLAALTPSPTPYVRPAAEIREQIECCAKFDGPTNKAWVAALTWTLTPPTEAGK